MKRGPRAPGMQNTAAPLRSRARQALHLLLTSAAASSSPAAGGGVAGAVSTFRGLALLGFCPANVSAKANPNPRSATTGDTARPATLATSTGQQKMSSRGEWEFPVLRWMWSCAETCGDISMSVNPIHGLEQNRPIKQLPHNIDRMPRTECHGPAKQPPWTSLSLAGHALVPG